MEGKAASYASDESLSLTSSRLREAGYEVETRKNGFVVRSTKKMERVAQHSFSALLTLRSVGGNLGAIGVLSQTDVLSENNIPFKG